MEELKGEEPQKIGHIFTKHMIICQLQRFYYSHIKKWKSSLKQLIFVRSHLSLATESEILAEKLSNA